MTENDLSVEDLPMTFQVKYLGARKTTGLWGVKNTRKPLDYLVESSIPRRNTLRFVDLTVSTDGLKIEDIINQCPAPPTTYPIDTISYGVQDIKYTRVFCMIVCNSQALEASAKNEGDPKTLEQAISRDNLFTCHAFLCQSRFHARRLTFALAAGFKHYAEVMKNGSPDTKEKLARTIDLRTPEQIADEGSETEA